MYKKLLLTIFLLGLVLPVHANTLNFGLTTAYPDTEPYYLGTQIKEIKIWITDNSNNIVAPVENQLEISIGPDKIQLYKKGVYFVSNTEFFLESKHVTANNLVIKIDTLLEGVTQTAKAYKLRDVSEYIKTELVNIKDFYNAGQTISFDIKYNTIASNISNPECVLIQPAIAENKFVCNELCQLNVEMPNATDNSKQEFKIFCYINVQGKLLPIYISKNIDLSSDLNVNILNPNNGVVDNPFVIELNAFYPNGLALENNSVSVKLNEKEKNITVLPDGTLQINYLLIPYMTLDKTIVLSYNGVDYKKKINIKLKPAFWFWIVIAVLLFIILINLVFALMKLLKKDNLNDLIAKRDLYLDKYKSLKKEYLAGRTTKAVYDELNSEYQINISLLNNKISKLKSITPKSQYSEIVHQIKNSSKLSIDDNKEENPPDELIKTLTKKQNKEVPELQNPEEKELEIPELPELKEELPTQSIFSKLFGKKKETEEKTLEDKIDEVKETLPKTENETDDENIDINVWKKKNIK